MAESADRRIKQAPDGTYYFRVHLGRDPFTGKDRQANRRGFTTRKAAKAALGNLEADARRVNPGIGDGGQTVAEYLAQWIDTIRPSLEPNTVDSYESAVRNWIVPHIGSMRLREVRPLTLQSLYGKLQTEGRCPRATKAKTRPARMDYMLTGGQGSRYHVVDIDGVPRDDSRDPSLPEDAPVSYCRRVGTPAQMPPGAGVCVKCLASFARTRPAAEPRGLGPRSVKLAHTVMHRALKQAVSWQLIDYNPAAQDLVLPKVPKSSATWWTPDQVKQFFASVILEVTEDADFEDHQWVTIWRLMLASGLRRGEALGLNWSDVDLDKEVALLRVVTSNTVERGRARLKDPKTEASKRVVVLDPPVVRLLKEHRRRQLEFRLLVGPAWQETGMIFTKADGTKLRPDTFNGVLTRACRRAGVPRLTAKGLRHSFASLALDRGVQMKLVQEIMGHSEITITAGIYTHSTVPLHREASAAVARFLFGEDEASSPAIRLRQG